MGNSFYSYETVKLWINEFKRARTSIEDASPPESPKSAVTPENIDKVHDIGLSVRRVKVRELVQAIGILIDRVHFLLHHELRIKKLCA